MHDITRTITPALAVWPGDTPFALRHDARLSEGATTNLTSMTMSAHTGTHADAPYHVSVTGEHPSEVALEPYLGPAHVATITKRHGGITPEDFAKRDLDGMERLLIHTWVSLWPDDRFPDDYPYPTLELVDWLAAKGVKLLGVDMPSVDRFDSQDLECHHRLVQHGIAILEGLKIVGTPDGVYELIALPLKIDGACGSPLRAILRDL